MPTNQSAVHPTNRTTTEVHVVVSQSESNVSQSISSTSGSVSIEPCKGTTGGDSKAAAVSANAAAAAATSTTENATAFNVLPTTNATNAPPQSNQVDIGLIKQEAVNITNDIVQRAKFEAIRQATLREQQQQQQQQATVTTKTQSSKPQSIEISDEELVEQDVADVEEVKEKLAAASSPQPSLEKPQELVPGLMSTSVGEDVVLLRDHALISSSESSQQLSESSRTPSSRPMSSEYDLTIIPEVNTASTQLSTTEYETCATTNELSFVTVPTHVSSSQEATFHTAQSQMSGQTLSNSMEMSSEGSETIMPSDEHATEDEQDEFDEFYLRTSAINTESIEPYNINAPLDLATSMLQPAIDSWEVVQMKKDSEFVVLDDDEPAVSSPSSQPSTSMSLGSEFVHVERGGFSPSGLYTHEEVEEEDSKTKSLSVGGVGGVRNEMNDSSSTSSSLREFERLESEVIIEKTTSTTTTTVAVPLSADLSVDSRSSLEPMKPERVGAQASFKSESSLAESSLLDNDESFTSELSQDTVTCIRKEELITLVDRPEMHQAGSIDEPRAPMLESFTDDIGTESDILSRSSASYHHQALLEQPNTATDSTTSSQPLLECDLPSLESSTIASVDLLCDDLPSLPHPSLIASDITQADDEVDDHHQQASSNVNNPGTN